MTERVSSRRFIDAMTARRFGPYVGVPCSFLRPFIDYVIDRDDLDYIAATNEGEALALASGAQIAGANPVVMLQNSGLGNLVNPLASLNYIFRIPVLLIITLRGEPGKKDEPQHELMGQTTQALLDLLKVEHEWFPERDADIDARIDHAVHRMAETGLPYAFILRKDVVDEYSPRPREGTSPRSMTPPLAEVSAGAIPARSEASALIADLAADSLIIATTGKTGRELCEYSDRANHFYMVGSMGCASSFALGVARECGNAVVVLDGDGAALMRLEAVASIGHQAPSRFIHVILDNESYESTGGQVTISASVRFPEIAAACGYASACSASGVDALQKAIQRALAENGPHLVHTRVGISTNATLGRPGVAPRDVATRFRSEISRRRGTP